MKKIYLFIFLGVLLIGCKDRPGEPSVVKTQFNAELARELKAMREIDQIAAYIPKGEYKELNPEEWKAFKDSVFTTHQERIAGIFEEYGYPGYDLVGEEGEQSFFLMVQHSDHDTNFQQKVLEKMKIEVEKGNADPGHYGLLVDRVSINTGKPQVYGTQTTYRHDICQAIPKSLADSANVDERRNKIGLPPLKEYLNRMSIIHFEINKERFLAKGITEPTLYELETEKNNSDG